MPSSQGTLNVNDVVISALRKSGVIGLGQTPNGADVLDAQDDLSDMLAQWNVKTWLVFQKLDVFVSADGRDTPYLIGPNPPLPAPPLDINLNPRPDRIEAAYIRILGTSAAPTSPWSGGFSPGFGPITNNGGGMPVDQPLRITPSREEYANIALKKLVAFSKAIFYDTASPVGNLFVYPWPQGGGLYEIHIIVKNSFPLTLPLNTDLSMLPPPARAAMKFCLAKRLRQAYGKGLRPDPELNALARDALETMRNSQIQVPELVMPAMLTSRGKYNIYGDITY